jgi:hypothetical protein
MGLSDFITGASYRRIDANVTIAGKKAFVKELTISNTVNELASIDLTMAPLSMSSETKAVGDTVINALGLSAINNTTIVDTDLVVNEAEALKKSIIDRKSYTESTSPLPGSASALSSLTPLGGLAVADIVVELEFSDIKGDLQQVKKAAKLLSGIGGLSSDSITKDVVGGSGGDGKLRYIATRPAASLGVGNASVSVSGIHPAALLSNINLYGYIQSSDIAPISAATASVASDVIFKLMALLGNLASPYGITEYIERIVGIFRLAEDEIISKATTFASAASMKAAVDLNRQYWGVFDQAFSQMNKTSSMIFGDSTAEPFLNPNSRINITRDIAQSLMTSSNLLDTILNVIAPKYMLQVFTDVFGDRIDIERSYVYAALVDNSVIGSIPDPLAETDATFIEAETSQVTYTLASKFQFPVARVIVNGNYETSWLMSLRGISDALKGDNDVIGMYPPAGDDRKGKLVRIAMPEFLNDAFEDVPGRESITEASGDKAPDPEHSNTFDGIQASATKVVDVVGDIIANKKNFLDRWAKGMYENLSQMYSTANVTTAFTRDTLQYQVGRIYTVKSKGGASLFRGYLHSVKHKVMIGENSGSSSTELYFTHITSFTAELVDSQLIKASRNLIGI